MSQTAFEADAFQNNAFQITGGPAPPSVPPTAMTDVYAPVQTFGGTYGTANLNDVYAPQQSLTGTVGN